MDTILAFSRWKFEESEEIDITGEKYLQLIDACFKYAQYFSLRVKEGGENSEISLLEPYFHMKKNENIFKCYGLGGEKEYPIADYIYKCCLETKAFLKSPQFSLFYWAGYQMRFPPEDLTFYRADGLILLETVAHDQDCFVYLQEDEIKDFIELTEWEKLQNRPYRDEHYFPQF